LPEFQNPNLQSSGGSGGGPGGGGTQTMMAMMFLAVAIFLGFQYFQKPQQSQPAPKQSEQQQPSAPAPALPGGEQSGGAQASGAQASGARSPASQRSPKPVPAAPIIAAAGETTTTVENDVFRIVFTNRGAVVKHWILKHYFQSDGRTPLDMVQQEASAHVQAEDEAHEHMGHLGFPLSLATYDPALTTQLNEALYQAPATGNAQAPSSITFRYAQNGIDVVKTFRFDKSYVIGVEVQVHRNGQPVRALIAWPAGLGDMEELQGHTGTVPFTRTPSNFAWSLDGKQDYTNAPKVANDATLEGSYQWAATADYYFAAAFLPENPPTATIVTFHNTIDLPDPNNASQRKPADVLGLAAGDTSGDSRVRLYVGPKQMDLVTSIHSIGPDGKQDGPSLRALIQFGWISVIATPLFWALRFLFDHAVPNWGWDIIILTVVFYSLMLPTRLMMMRSSLKMMRIQPEVERLKRKYANLKPTDPKRAEMNTEMMALYKTHGVNMYGGCLPLIIQMPLFIAYFRVLQYTVELRQAHWGWLHDLSQPDPLHILPILIIVSMFLTQFITPSPGMDPTQRRMMAIMMPAIFGFMLWQYAAGLALYWGTGNLINLAIQIGINQSHIGKEMHALAAKRAAKKSGVNPKTLQGRR
jgi:YidC/Oxa1 family membrane protein insertase